MVCYNDSPSPFTTQPFPFYLPTAPIWLHTIRLANNVGDIAEGCLTLNTEELDSCLRRNCLYENGAFVLYWKTEEEDKGWGWGSLGPEDNDGVLVRVAPEPGEISEVVLGEEERIRKQPSRRALQDVGSEPVLAPRDAAPSTSKTGEDAASSGGPDNGNNNGGTVLDQGGENGADGMQRTSLLLLSVCAIIWTVGF